MNDLTQNAALGTLEQLVLPLIEQLAKEGWCVALKKLPVYLGWYFGEVTGGRQLPGTWTCEASWADYEKEPWRHTEFACKPTALEAVQEVVKRCRQNTEDQISSGAR
jgi:hypothetical protein